MKPSARILFSRLALAVLTLLLGTGQAQAHCDTMNGPVVTAARKALETRDVRFALIWVKPSDEKEIIDAFAKTLTVRSLGPDAQALADRSFFETLVRVHRAGEGAAYTGLKQESEPSPGIAGAERALEEGKPGHLVADLTKALTSGLETSFGKVSALKSFDPKDVPAGRAYVEAYVEYIHYVERVAAAIESGTVSEQHSEHNH